VARHGDVHLLPQLLFVVFFKLFRVAVVAKRSHEAVKIHRQLDSVEVVVGNKVIFDHFLDSFARLESADGVTHSPSLNFLARLSKDTLILVTRVMYASLSFAQHTCRDRVGNGDHALVEPERDFVFLPFAEDGVVETECLNFRARVTPTQIAV
jgi:hypothetical protein